MSNEQQFSKKTSKLSFNNNYQSTLDEESEDHEDNNNNNNSNNSNIEPPIHRNSNLTSPQSFHHQHLQFSQSSTKMNETQVTPILKSSHRPSVRSISEFPNVIGANCNEYENDVCTSILTVLSWCLVILFFPLSLLCTFRIIQEYERGRFDSHQTFSFFIIIFYNFSRYFPSWALEK
jgi:hypothetical protein